ncbi:MAG: glycoside hydrolase family 3 C-terminal domain-containing protein [Rikenellaceae bacterium]
MKKLILLFTIALLTTNKTIFAQHAWRDASKPLNERIELLLNELTIDEKLHYFSSDIPAIERLGLPSYMWYDEALHGMIAFGATSFPQNNAMGSTWNRELMLEVATAISDEGRGYSNHSNKKVMMFSPTVNMSRDPRWGRNEECYSEDPYHMSEMARMYVRGMQGTDPNYLKTVCTVKHFVANNVEHKREEIQSMINERDLREYYLPAYKACVVDERAAGIMTALNGLNGVPCSANDWLINGVLRKEWGFEGYVIADWGAVGGVNHFQHYRDNYEEAAAAALLAGCDQECFRPKESHMVKSLKVALEKGLVTEEDINVSVRRLLRLQFLVGDLDQTDNSPYASIPKSAMGSTSNEALALKAAEQSIVLLKNEKNTLPLNKNKVESIAVVGPFADRCWLGIYSGWPKTMVSPLEGIKNHYKGDIHYAKGCEVTQEDDSINMKEAIECAAKAEVVVAFVGNDNLTATENTDRESLHLPGRQEQLLEELCKVNKNVIVVIVPSGATILGDTQNKAKAIVCGWANGQQQGNAIAKMLFGDVNPSGKLNTTWFASDSDLPAMDNYNIRENRTYTYFKGKPLYPYGYGLSYTKFQYSNMKLDKSHVAKEGVLKVSVDVKNSGKRDGDEIIQIYIKDNCNQEVEAACALKGFERISLKAGETKNVVFELPYDNWSHWSVDGEKFVVGSGDYDVLIGASSADIRLRKSVIVDGGDVAEHSLRTVNFDNFNSKKYSYKGSGNDTVEEKTAETSSNTAEFIVTFVDPGFYVSQWDIELNYSAVNEDSEATLWLDGVEIGKYKLKYTGRAEKFTTSKISIPKPTYDTATRLKLTMDDKSTIIKSIAIINPKDGQRKFYH